ncbi:hypothetical protein Cadr_000000881 [Camelus dromedarius]|uniref:Uncharacterized protein n=1 Tax=Camelus dromedarius TaxID=9838 RepID=A0A5N4EHK1_CAMDR|nr:hypothetical protein Cadr_000000881 [Camelus dromedarius]
MKGGTDFPKKELPNQKPGRPWGDQSGGDGFPTVLRTWHFCGNCYWEWNPGGLWAGENLGYDATLDLALDHVHECWELGPSPFAEEEVDL